MSIPGGLGWRLTVAAPATGVAVAAAPIVRLSSTASRRPADPTLAPPAPGPGRRRVRTR